MSFKESVTIHPSLTETNSAIHSFPILGVKGNSETIRRETNFSNLVSFRHLPTNNMNEEQRSQLGDLFAASRDYFSLDEDSDQVRRALLDRLDSPEYLDTHVILAYKEDSLIGAVEFVPRTVGDVEEGGILRDFQYLCEKEQIPKLPDGTNVATIYFIYTHPEHLGQGVATSMYSELAKQYQPAYIFGWTRSAAAVIARYNGLDNYNHYLSSIPLGAKHTNSYINTLIQAAIMWNPTMKFARDVEILTTDGEMLPLYILEVPTSEVKYPISRPPTLLQTSLPDLYPLFHLTYFAEYYQRRRHPISHLFPIVSVNQDHFPDWSGQQRGEIERAYFWGDINVAETFTENLLDECFNPESKLTEKEIHAITSLYYFKTDFSKPLRWFELFQETNLGNEDYSYSLKFMVDLFFKPGFVAKELTDIETFEFALPVLFPSIERRAREYEKGKIELNIPEEIAAILMFHKIGQVYNRTSEREKKIADLEGKLRELMRARKS